MVSSYNASPSLPRRTVKQKATKQVKHAAMHWWKPILSWFSTAGANTRTAVGLTSMSLYIFVMSALALAALTWTRGAGTSIILYTAAAAIAITVVYLLMPCLIEGGCMRFAFLITTCVHAAMLVLLVHLAATPPPTLW